MVTVLIRLKRNGKWEKIHCTLFQESERMFYIHTKRFSWMYPKALYEVIREEGV